ncbi:hypothetical protein B0T22DRAFT_74679 [Podospora appendiculata]|uniref:Secreted protein n=1 Tax=Podospora appendiculata TaxID=314037 RepID=A0AAE0XKG0_9PEZI|nr:hypothetical protein B0T22DRAFT_74679 [Podospora appendiculata]
MMIWRWFIYYLYWLRASQTEPEVGLGTKYFSSLGCRVAFWAAFGCQAWRKGLGTLTPHPARPALPDPKATTLELAPFHVIRLESSSPAIRQSSASKSPPTCNSAYLGTVL